jgi:hypothetical protein
LRSISLHWTAGDYRTVYSAYHFCVSLGDDERPQVIATHDLRANMRDVRAESGAPYAAHTFGRNSYAIGVAVAAMGGATPYDFGAYPLRDDMLGLMCRLVRRLCTAYAIPVTRATVRTHAEAALDDGYFGDGEDERWDIARLRAQPRALVPAEAIATADRLRAWIAAS